MNNNNISLKNKNLMTDIGCKVYNSLAKDYEEPIVACWQMKTGTGKSYTTAKFFCVYGFNQFFDKIQKYCKTKNIINSEISVNELYECIINVNSKLIYSSLTIQMMKDFKEEFSKICKKEFLKKFYDLYPSFKEVKFNVWEEFFRINKNIPIGELINKLNEIGIEVLEKINLDDWIDYVFKMIFYFSIECFQDEKELFLDLILKGNGLEEIKNFLDNYILIEEETKLLDDAKKLEKCCNRFERIKSLNDEEEIHNRSDECFVLFTKVLHTYFWNKASKIFKKNNGITTTEMLSIYETNNDLWWLEKFFPALKFKRCNIFCLTIQKSNGNLNLGFSPISFNRFINKAFWVWDEADKQKSVLRNFFVENLKVKELQEQYKNLVNVLNEIRGKEGTVAIVYSDETKSCLIEALYFKQSIDSKWRTYGLLIKEHNNEQANPNSVFFTGGGLNNTEIDMGYTQVKKTNNKNKEKENNEIKKNFENLCVIVDGVDNVLKKNPTKENSINKKDVEKKSFISFTELDDLINIKLFDKVFNIINSLWKTVFENEIEKKIKRGFSREKAFDIVNDEKEELIQNLLKTVCNIDIKTAPLLYNDIMEQFYLVSQRNPRKRLLGRENLQMKMGYLEKDREWNSKFDVVNYKESTNVIKPDDYLVRLVERKEATIVLLSASIGVKHPDNWNFNYLKTKLGNNFFMINDRYKEEMDKIISLAEEHDKSDVIVNYVYNFNQSKNRCLINTDFDDLINIYYKLVKEKTGCDIKSLPEEKIFYYNRLEKIIVAVWQFLQSGESNALFLTNRYHKECSGEFDICVDKELNVLFVLRKIFEKYNVIFISFNSKGKNNCLKSRDEALKNGKRCVMLSAYNSSGQGVNLQTETIIDKEITKKDIPFIYLEYPSNITFSSIYNYKYTPNIENSFKECLINFGKLLDANTEGVLYDLVINQEITNVDKEFGVLVKGMSDISSIILENNKARTLEVLKAIDLTDYGKGGYVRILIQSCGRGTREINKSGKQYFCLDDKWGECSGVLNHTNVRHCGKQMSAVCDFLTTESNDARNKIFLDDFEKANTKKSNSFKGNADWIVNRMLNGYEYDDILRYRRIGNIALKMPMIRDLNDAYGVWFKDDSIDYVIDINSIPLEQQKNYSRYSLDVFYFDEIINEYYVKNYGSNEYTHYIFRNNNEEGMLKKINLLELPLIQKILKDNFIRDKLKEKGFFVDWNKNYYQPLPSFLQQFVLPRFSEEIFRIYMEEYFKIKCNELEECCFEMFDFIIDNQKVFFDIKTYSSYKYDDLKSEGIRKRKKLGKEDWWIVYVNVGGDEQYHNNKMSIDYDNKVIGIAWLFYESKFNFDEIKTMLDIVLEEV